MGIEELRRPSKPLFLGFLLTPVFSCSHSVVIKYKMTVKRILNNNCVLFRSERTFFSEL